MRCAFVTWGTENAGCTRRARNLRFNTPIFGPLAERIVRLSWMSLVASVQKERKQSLHEKLAATLGTGLARTGTNSRNEISLPLSRTTLGTGDSDTHWH